MTIKSYLPVFPGFYGTLFEADETNAIEDGKTYDDYEWDYTEYKRRIAVACCGFVENELKNFGVKVNFENVYSPREYNFTNDSINVEYSVNNLKPIRNYLKDNREAFELYLKENYSSYDGFISFHETDFESWFTDIIDEHKFGAILDFILLNEDEDAQTSMYYAVDSELYVDCRLIEE